MFDEKAIEIENLFLDPKNYRIDFERYNTVEKAVERLYIDEDIVGMIKGIVNFPGIYPHEKLIVTPMEGGKYKVKEGNRRVLAIKSILGLVELPPKYKKEVLALSKNLSSETVESLRHIGAVVYEINDKSYLKILADKHSTISYQRWGQISQWHFFKDLYESNGMDINQTAKELGKSISDISNYIRFYNLFSYIRKLEYWDENDLRDQIESNNLKATKFTRPLSFTVVKNALGIEFDEQNKIKTPINAKDLFDEVLCKYVKASLIDDKSEDDYIFTRSTPEQVVELIDGWKNESGIKGEHRKTPEDEKGKPENSENTGTGTNEGSASQRKKQNTHKHSGGPPERYFRSLYRDITVKDQRLKRLTYELSKNDMADRPVSGTLLGRSLIESALIYRLTEKGLLEKIKSEHNRNIDDIKFSKIISFCINNVQALFKDSKNAKECLEKIQSDHRDYMNSIVHGSWLDPNAGEIEKIAGTTRELLRTILTEKE